MPPGGRTIAGMTTNTLIPNTPDSLPTLTGARTTEAFRVPSRFAGQPGIAKAGWLSGRLAARLPPGTTVDVAMRAPTPVDQDLTLDVDHARQLVRVFDGDLLLAEAQPANASPLAPPAVEWAQAALAEISFPGRWDHPFPACFGCGDRAPGDGLRIFPGPVSSRPGTFAARWTPGPADVTHDGAVPIEHVWAALDCPTGWVHHRPGGLALLVRMTARLHRAARPCEDYVVVARDDRRTGRSGRRMLSRSAIYTRTGTLIATAGATWLEVPR
jgi:hypothetical protein